MDRFKPGDFVQFRPVEELEAHITEWFNEPGMNISESIERNYRNEIYSYANKIYTVESVENCGSRHLHVNLENIGTTKVIHPELLKLYNPEINSSIPDMFGEMIYEQKT